ncbi:keratocan [Eucyclogobius newberryi]|uniref:keratocan n=1 Tax=Eucyclogobius newberryi TaxID=166745 RepID=UPI003B5C311A
MHRMEIPMNIIYIMCLLGSVLSQDMSYEEIRVQLQACPKACRCPQDFPRAVYCDSKGLTTIPTIPPHTWYLYLQNNNIAVLSADALRNATQLRWLNLNRNKITSDGVESDVLSTMSQLAHLYMDDNLLSSVPSPLPPSLEHLRLSRNRISKIPAGIFSGLDKLTLLDLQSNKLMDDAVTEVSLKGLNNLVQINLAKNHLTSMPVGLPPTTTQLFLDGNNIDKIPTGYFKGLPKMAFIRLNYNKLASSGVPKDVFNVSSILDLQLSHNQLTEVPLIPSGLEHLYLDHNNISTVSGSSVCPDSADLMDDTNESGPRLRYLRLDGNEIKPPIPSDIISCFRLLTSIII